MKGLSLELSGRRCLNSFRKIFQRPKLPRNASGKLSGNLSETSSYSSFSRFPSSETVFCFLTVCSEKIMQGSYSSYNIPAFPACSRSVHTYADKKARPIPPQKLLYYGTFVSERQGYPTKNVPRGTRLRGRVKRSKPLIYKGLRLVVTVGLEPTTPSM